MAHTSTGRTLLFSVMLAAASTVAMAHGGAEHLMGTIKATGPSSITVETTDHKEVNLTTDDKTQYQQGSSAATAKDLQVGARVVIHARKVDKTLVATVVKLPAKKATAEPTKEERPATVPASRDVEIVVDQGYKPSRVEVKEGETVRLKVVRRDYTPCTKEIVFPTLKISRSLPTNEPVSIELPSLKPGEYEFRCGMNMLRGTLVVLPR